MGFDGGYGQALRTRFLLLAGLGALITLVGVYAVAAGSYDLSILKVVRTLLGLEDGPSRIVVWNIRLPRIVAAILSGWALGVSGAAIQSLLKNPLASPFTLGISHGAALGAAFAIVVLGAGGTQYGALRTQAASMLTVNSPVTVSACAFVGAMAATLVIVLLSRLRKFSSGAIILAGVALSSLCLSGTILIQYFADEVELASIVFWTFGDVSRSSWEEIGVLAVVSLAGGGLLLLRRLDLNALTAGEDTAVSLGVNVARLRLTGMTVAALMASLVVAFHGVIAFLGLLAPHIARRIVGPEHGQLIPHAGAWGALLLLGADTAGRLFVSSGTLPVGVLTSFMGAPLFLSLLMGDNRI